MQFAIIAFDGTDDGAVDRRLIVRDQHISLGNEMVKSGQALFPWLPEPKHFREGSANR